MLEERHTVRVTPQSKACPGPPSDGSAVTIEGKGTQPDLGSKILKFGGASKVLGVRWGGSLSPKDPDSRARICISKNLGDSKARIGDHSWRNCSRFLYQMELLAAHVL